MLAVTALSEASRHSGGASTALKPFGMHGQALSTMILKRTSASGDS